MISLNRGNLTVHCLYFPIFPKMKHEFSQKKEKFLISYVFYFILHILFLCHVLCTSMFLFCYEHHTIFSIYSSFLMSDCNQFSHINGRDQSIALLCNTTKINPSIQKPKTFQKLKRILRSFSKIKIPINS